MSRRTRYFDNPYPDYDGRNAVQVNPEVWTRQALSLALNIQQNGRSVLQAVDGGLYVGSAGVGFAFMDLASKFPESSSERNSLLDFAAQLVDANLKYIDQPDFRRDKQVQIGFLLGATGVHAVAAVLAKLQGDGEGSKFWADKYASVADLCLPLQVHSCGSDELFVGRAGYICGALWLRRELGRDVVPLQKLHQICDAIIESGRAYSRRKRSQSPLMFAYYETEYLGAAHGLCAILQMLLSVPEYFRQNPEAEADVKNATLFLTSIQTQTGNVPCAMDEAPPFPPRRDEDDLVHWCHGAPGTAYLFVKAFLAWRDETFLNAALRCGDCVWQRGLLRKGPGICHGVAGSGYVFLLLHRLTSDPRHVYRATKVAEFLFTDEFKTARTPDCPHSLYEGTAGTVCFLSALANPGSAAFPFFNVFE